MSDNSATMAALDTSRLKEIIKEYVDRLIKVSFDVEQTHRGFASEAIDSGTARGRGIQLQLLLQKLTAPTIELNQRISQMIEHGRVDELARLELRLHLAELEYALAAAQQSFSSYPVP